MQNVSLRKRSQPARVAAGDVYFIREGACGGPVKIGLSLGADMRRDTLQAGNPRPLYVEAVIAGGEGLERRLHNIFAEGRMEGEWFAPDTPRLERFIEGARHFEAMGGEDPWSPISRMVLGVRDAATDEQARRRLELWCATFDCWGAELVETVAADA